MMDPMNPDRNIDKATTEEITKKIYINPIMKCDIKIIPILASAIPHRIEIIIADEVDNIKI